MFWLSYVSFSILSDVFCPKSVFSYNLHQNDNKLQTNPSSMYPYIKMPNLPKVDVYKCRYEISLRNIVKLFFLSHKCINKYVHKLEHK